MAANVTFDAFLAGMATLGTVNTRDGGFQQALGAALLDSGKLKSWSSPATAQQPGSQAASRDTDLQMRAGSRQGSNYPNTAFGRLLAPEAFEHS